MIFTNIILLEICTKWHGQRIYIKLLKYLIIILLNNKFDWRRRVTDATNKKRLRGGTLENIVRSS